MLLQRCKLLLCGWNEQWKFAELPLSTDNLRNSVENLRSSGGWGALRGSLHAAKALRTLMKPLKVIGSIVL
jgi:hypothetical protein